MYYCLDVEGAARRKRNYNAMNPSAAHLLKHREDSGGDASRGHTRSHPEHEGKDLDGRWYYAGDGMGEQVAAGFKENYPYGFR